MEYMTIILKGMYGILGMQKNSGMQRISWKQGIQGIMGKIEQQ